MFKNKTLRELIIPVSICIAFFVLYAILSIVRHNHFQSFGYDLGINDQVVWEYSKLSPPISTIGPHPGMLKFVSHVEIIFALLSPFYWIWSNALMLLLLEPFFFCLSGIAIYLLAKSRHLNKFLIIAIVISYLGFYGVQNAIWFDVHSITFGASFLAWFLYFIQTKKTKLTILFFILAIISKENFAFICFFISFVYFIARKDKLSFVLMLSSMAYTIFIFFIFFPDILQTTYQYANSGGLFSNLDITALFDTKEKIRVIFYTLISFGFIPITNPLILIPALGDIGTYFVIGSDLTGAQGLYMQYRVTLSPLMAWATIMTVSKYKFLNNKWIGMYLILSIMLVQYNLHLPLSYLSKQWFWHEPASVNAINNIISDYLPANASVVAQNNIIPHISQRYKIYELYPEQKNFSLNSPCGQSTCAWFRWFDNPEYLLVDTSSEWDIRHFLANREDYIKGLQNLEKAKIIYKYKQQGTTILYKVLKNPG